MQVTRLLMYLVLLSQPMFALSGICTSDPVASDSHHEFQLFAGYSPASATLIGTARNRHFVAAGFNYSYRCWAWNQVSVSFTAGIMPAAILLQPREPVFGTSRFQYQTIQSHAVYGFGVTPIGFTVDVARTHSLFPFFQTDGGIIASTEPIPENITGATAVNFMFDFGGGLKWQPASKHYALTWGFKFLHISNAGRSPVNPGIDNTVFYAGYSFLR